MFLANFKTKKVHLAAYNVQTIHLLNLVIKLYVFHAIRARKRMVLVVQNVLVVMQERPELVSMEDVKNAKSVNIVRLVIQTLIRVVHVKLVDIPM